MTSEGSVYVNDGTLNVKMLKMVGFKTLLSWHYLILFSPLFIGSIEQSSFSFFFQRQLTLYVTLALSFGALVGVGRLFLKRNRTMPSPYLLVFAGVLATLATLLSALALDVDGSLKLVAVVLLGLSEAFLMLLWLHYYAVAAAGRLFRSFSVDMIFGGVVGFLTCSLQHPLGLIVAVCLPLVATVSLIMNWREVEPVVEVDRCVLLSPPRKSILRHSLKTLLPTMVYAFVFGLIQGAFLVSDIALLMAGNPIVLVGVVIAGVIIFFIHEQPGTNADIDVMHRCSLLFFVLGMVGLSLMGGGDIILIVSEIAILAGFNLFDFGGLILDVGLARRFKSDSLKLVDGGRVLTYASLALGLAAGDRLMVLFGGGQNEFLLPIICGIAITLLTATVLTPFRAQEPFERQIARERDEERSNAGTLDTEPPVCKGLDRVHDPAADDGSVRLKPTSDHVEESKKEDTPWRRTCRTIAELYRLSPRETEIFFLIAKGRNAEFVQKKLVISTHTAKTHIANIYHKLGVHSSQEMLSLVEDFREEERKAWARRV